MVMESPIKIQSSFVGTMQDTVKFLMMFVPPVLPMEKYPLFPMQVFVGTPLAFKVETAGFAVGWLAVNVEIT